MSLDEYFCCPRCRSPLDWAETATHCSACAASYPVCDGVADFRISVAPEARAREWQRAAELLEGVHVKSFTDLLRAYVERTSEPDVLELELSYELNWSKRGRKELFRLQDLLRRLSGRRVEDLLGPSVCLDIGCGKGVLLATVAPKTKHIIGIDYSVECVIFARALLKEFGIANCSVAVAEGENLPVRDQSVDFVSALDVVEHVSDPRLAISQAFRVLRSNGHLFLNSPNRYSLMAPEDHCQLWFVGFVPYRWQQRYVHWRSGHSYKNVHLLSYKAVKSLLRPRAQRIIEACAMVDPNADDSLRNRVLNSVSLVRWLLNIPPFKYVTPSHHFLATKKHLPDATSG